MSATTTMPMLGRNSAGSRRTRPLAPPRSSRSGELVEDAPALPVAAPKAPAKPRAFDAFNDKALLECAVPPDWLADDRVAGEDSLFDIAEHLPAEAAEALLNLAVGIAPAPAETEPAADPCARPDAHRRFRLMKNSEELKAALDAPWEAWTVFLHPSQRDFDERDFGSVIDSWIISSLAPTQRIEGARLERSRHRRGADPGGHRDPCLG
jgi:hypothetical protein